MLEMAPQNAPAELAYVGHDKGRAKLGPSNELGRFWVVDHPRGRGVVST